MTVTNSAAVSVGDQVFLRPGLSVPGEYIYLGRKSQNHEALGFGCETFLLGTCVCSPGVLEGRGTFRRWSLTGGSEPLGVGLKY